MRYCSDAGSLNLSFFSEKYSLAGLSDDELKKQGSSLIVDYRVARRLNAGVGDYLEVGESDCHLMVGRICPTIKSYSAPVVVVVSDAAIAELVPDDALAETVFVSVSDCDEAQRFFESEYPLINTDIEERYRTLVYNQEVSTKTKDISAASEGVLRLGLIVVLFCLGLLFNPRCGQK